MNIEKLNIISKILLPILLLAVAVVIGYSGLTEIDRQIRLIVGNNLITVLKATNESHAVWIEGNYSYLKHIAEKPEVAISVMNYLMMKKKKILVIVLASKSHMGIPK